MSMFGGGPSKNEVHNYFQTINQKLDRILDNQKKIIMKQSELAAALTSVKDQLTKAKDEILAKIAALQTSDPDISPEGQAALDSLKAIAQALDDVVEDVPPPVEPA